ncbi:hypothetical protein [Paenibacillus herberti]|uniref:Uncharacterized protein n=1 Tax=Paenibacillus herberti TaxID=1619309 RepID=A0A229NYK4_9BACL|nr:hypothetical protein [Paenibacillus herberti]OXM14825.1 hypothetical protein CGZ75_18320 [Paenibacillus herberti]
MINKVIISLISASIVTFAIPLVIMIDSDESFTIAFFIVASVYAAMYVFTYGFLASLIAIYFFRLNDIKSSVFRVLILLGFGAAPFFLDIGFGYTSLIAAFLYSLAFEILTRTKKV